MLLFALDCVHQGCLISPDCVQKNIREGNLQPSPNHPFKPDHRHRILHTRIWVQSTLLWKSTGRRCWTKAKVWSSWQKSKLIYSSSKLLGGESTLVLMHFVLSAALPPVNHQAASGVSSVGAARLRVNNSLSRETPAVSILPKDPGTAASDWARHYWSSALPALYHLTHIFFFSKEKTKLLLRRKELQIPPEVSCHLHF